MRKNRIILTIFNIILMFIMSYCTSFYHSNNYSNVWFVIIVLTVVLFVVQMKYQDIQSILYLKYFVPLIIAFSFLIEHVDQVFHIVSEAGLKIDRLFLFYIGPIYIMYLIFTLLQVLFLVLEYRYQDQNHNKFILLIIFLFSVTLVYYGLTEYQYAISLSGLSSIHPNEIRNYKNNSELIILIGMIGIGYSLIRSYFKKGS